MKLSQFKFKLPEELIALNPPYHRDECRLMVVHRVSQKIEMYKKDENGEPLKDKDGNPEYLDFRNVLDYFDEGDAFIFNDTKVFPARLYGTKEKTDAKIEVFLLRELNEEMRLWDVLVEPARKIRIGNKLFLTRAEAWWPRLSTTLQAADARCVSFTTVLTMSSSTTSTHSERLRCRII